MTHPCYVSSVELDRAHFTSPLLFLGLLRTMAATTSQATAQRAYTITRPYVIHTIWFIFIYISMFVSG